MQRLMHRWFVEYNPLYLLSAALVLGGLTLVSQEAARHASLVGELGVAGIAEVYAFALIGGAAFLTRIGLRRPAVMLGLLAVLFLGDLTLHVETCAYLGVVGRVAAGLWLVLFVAKLVLLAWAFELRPSLSAWLVPVLAALGLAVLPQVLREVDEGLGTALVALWVFGIGAAGLWTERAVRSAVALDVRGERALRGAWVLLGLLSLAHAFYWVWEHHLQIAGLLPALMLLGARWLRRERSLFGLVASTLILVGIFAPPWLSIAGLMGAVVLVLRAVRAPSSNRPIAPAPPPEPYREAAFAPPPPDHVEILGLAEPRAIERLVLGALACVHLSVWTMGWSGGEWPEHSFALDLGLAVACAALAYRTRRPLALAPVAVTYLHLFVLLGWITVPRGAMQWGLSSIGLGFFFLIASLLVSWRLRRPPEVEPDADIA